MVCSLGKEVGYEVRFDQKCGSATKIKYMTDGTLLNHCLTDPRLRNYGVIMIDEGHERSIHTDVLLGLLKLIAVKRKDLKIIITSATMRTEIFSKYFNGAPILSLEGRLFPVDVIYRPIRHFVTESIKLIKKIHAEDKEGDILVFLTGQNEIDLCCDALTNIKDLVVLPLMSFMDSDSQSKIFMKVDRGKRKVVVATNIAETTITIEGIKHVIDCGYVKHGKFDFRLGIEVLTQTRISKAQANQRKGRAGRTCRGRCYRLYNEATYNNMPDEAVPEIKRKNLCDIYLRILIMGLDPLNFDFIDRPDHDALKKSEWELQDLNFLDDSKRLTDIGKRMCDLPVDPIMGKVLITSNSFICTDTCLIMMLMVGKGNAFVRPPNKSEEADMFHERFYDIEGDHFTGLNVFQEFENSRRSKIWCENHFLNIDVLIEVFEARKQLMLIIQGKISFSKASSTDNLKRSCQRAIIKGYYKNICYKISKGVYIRYFNDEKVYIHPGSCLFHISPSLILYHELSMTSKIYMRGLMQLEPSMLADFPEEMAKINYVL